MVSSLTVCNRMLSDALCNRYMAAGDHTRSLGYISAIFSDLVASEVVTRPTFRFSFLHALHWLGRLTVRDYRDVQLKRSAGRSLPASYVAERQIALQIEAAPSPRCLEMTCHALTDSFESLSLGPSGSSMRESR